MTRAILRAASWIVPRPLRADWRAEWTAELAYIAHVEPTRAVPFALGAFRDAFWLRRETPRTPLCDSPARCLLSVALIAALGALAARPTVPWFATLFTLAVAMILLPTFVTLSFARQRPVARAFFAIKMALALIAAYTGTEALAAILAPAMRPHGLLIGFVIAMRWAFRDQHRRCPTCLRLLARPVSFGCLGHILLEWHGNEYICPKGHGLMQVSASPTSPYAPQHWQPL